jgi:hypothetical protein
MISDELVSLETAKLAKEKGFNWLCSSVKIETIEGSEREVYDEEECRYATVKDVIKTRIPTQTRLQRWLREEKMMHIEIAHNPMYGGFMPYISKIVEGEGVFTLLEKNCYCIAMQNATYEKALEAGLQYALEHSEMWDIKEE